METPWGAAKTIAAFMNKKFDEYSEKEPATGKPYGVYAGFLPIADKAAEMQKLCPAIVIRPLIIIDGEKETLAKMVIYAVVFDADKKTGCESLYHLLQFMRYHLLSNNPINDSYQIKLTEDETMETFIPDEQPFPFWEGRIDFAVYLEQPSNTSIVSKMNSWRRGNNGEGHKKG